MFEYKVVGFVFLFSLELILYFLNPSFKNFILSEINIRENVMWFILTFKCTSVIEVKLRRAEGFHPF